MNTVKQDYDNNQQYDPANDRPSVHVIKVKSYNDAKAIGEEISKGIAVLMNTSELQSREIFNRMIDYLSGYTDCCNGKIAKMSQDLILICPLSVDLSGDLFMSYYDEY